MLMALASVWISAATAQAPAEAGWLRAVPADVPVVVRARSAEALRDDLRAMIKAMSPAADEAVGEGLDQAMQGLVGMLGEGAGRSPVLALVRLPDPDRPAIPPWAVMLKVDDHRALLRALTGGDAEPKSRDGLDTFTGPDGRDWFATRGDGWSALGADEAIIRSLRRPGATLDAALSPPLRGRLLAGDVGVYVNVAEAQRRYAAALERARPAFLDLVRQANPGQAQAQEGARAMIDGLMALLRVGDGVALSVDFDAAGLSLAALATVRRDSAEAKALTAARAGTADLMERLPDDLMAYFFLADSADGGPVPRPGRPTRATSPGEADAVAARMKALGGRLVMGMSFLPMRGAGLADPPDPAAVVRATRAASRARRAAKAEEGAVEPEALTHGGFRLDRTRIKIDLGMLRAARPDLPNPEAIFKLVLPGEALTEYNGTDGALFLTLVGATEAQAKAEIDALKAGSRRLGGLASWKALRPRLPRRASALVVLNAQEFVRMAVQGYGAATGNAALKVPADLPQAPALMGFALVRSPEGYDVRLVVPSEVGPVLEKGLAPLAEDE